MTIELELLIRERIERDGPMPFAAFMSQALYHPKLGYYSRGLPRTGWSGHYVTSPELDPVFGGLWARAFEQVWEKCGRPSTFRVTEVGPGEGSFAGAVMEAAQGNFRDAMSYVLVERVPRVEERQRERLSSFDRVEWVKSVGEIHPGSGVVFANEVLDNLPVHLAEFRDGVLLEVLVELDNDHLVLTRRRPAGPELGDFIGRSGIVLQEGNIHELPMATESFLSRAAGVIDSGAIFCVDYGLDARGMSERPEGTIACYSNSGVDAEPLERIGEKDITVHANWTVVGHALRGVGLKVVGPLLQRRVLSELGLSERDEVFRQEHAEALASKRGAAAIRALSRRQALGALADPGGLGGLQVVSGLKDIEPPPFLSTPS